MLRAKRRDMLTLLAAALVIVLWARLAVDRGGRSDPHPSLPAATSATPATSTTVPSTTVPSTSSTIAVPGAGLLRVSLFGDSLAVEAQHTFVSTLTATGRVAVRTHTFGGTAICDFFDAMRADLADFHPHAVVMVYSGNAMTPCMDEAPGGSDDYYERYHADADAVMALYEPLGVRVYWVGTPITREESEAHDSSWTVLNLMYSDLADHHAGAFYVDAGQAVMRGGEYADFLPCLPTEPCVGMPDPVTGEPSNRVRSPDGTHFCPVQVERDSTTGCPVWSSGAWRFGITMADPIVRDFGLRPTSAR